MDVSQSFTEDVHERARRPYDKNHQGQQRNVPTKVLNEFTGEMMSVPAYLGFLKDAINEKKRGVNISPEEAREALFDLEDRLYTLIDFRDKMLVFLDRPDPALWNELLSVLSHDKEHIVTSFVEGEGFKRNRRVVFQG